jgi:hypothetical protein
MRLHHHFLLMVLISQGCSERARPAVPGALSTQSKAMTEKTPTAGTVMTKFQPGQVWRYNTRPDEAQSRLTILKVESHDKLGTIVHIAIEGVSVKAPAAPGGVSRVISHLPFGEDSLRKSVTELERSVERLPEYEEGYRQWKEAFDAGKGGIWTTPVSEAIAAMEQALNR